jgi:hypothetical protein
MASFRDTLTAAWVTSAADPLGTPAANFGQFLSGVFGACTFIVASIAGLTAIWQIRSSRISQNEATAKSLYQTYLRMCFDHPDLANPSLSKFSCSEYAKYEWFVSCLLWAVEE